MKDRYDIFGGLPDTIEDDWIETEETLEKMMDKCGFRRMVPTHSNRRGPPIPIEESHLFRSKWAT